MYMLEMSVQIQIQTEKSIIKFLETRITCPEEATVGNSRANNMNTSMFSRKKSLVAVRV